MKKGILKSSLAALLLLLVAIPLLFACDRTPEGDKETTDSGVTEAPAQTEPPIVTGQVLNDKKTFEIESGDSVLRLAIQGNTLFVIDAHTKKRNVNRIAEPMPFSLPQEYAKATGSKVYHTIPWTYEGYLNYRPEGAQKGKYGYIFRFVSSDLGITYDLYVTAHKEMAGPFEFTGYLENEGEKALRLRPEVYFSVRTQGEIAPQIWSFDKESGVAEGWKIYDGTYFAGTGIYKKKLSAKRQVKVVTTTDQGWNAGGDIPMFYVDHGTRYGFYYGIEWSNCQLSAESKQGDGDCIVKAQLGTNGFETTVPKDSTFYLPTVYMGIYDGDVDTASNVFKRWFIEIKSPDILLQNENEPLVQRDAQGDWANSAQYGVQSIKWDYGWWSTEIAPGHTRWQIKEGLLELDPKTGHATYLKNNGLATMKELSDYMKKKELSWAVYTLLKDCEVDREGVPTSVGKYGHPEWFSNRVVTVGKSADLGNVDCVAFYKDYLFNFFKGNGITTWRSDFEPICRESDKKNRHDAGGNDVQYWCTVGFLELVDHLYANIDGFRYESCSSGGSMKDLLTATRAVVINCDDSADFHSLKMSFYDSSYCFHPAQLQLPTNSRTYMRNSKYYSGVGDYVYGLRSQLVGAVHLCTWDGVVGNEDIFWQRYLTVYNAKIKPLIKHGDLYHILPRPDGVNWDGIQYVDLDSASSTKGIVMVWKPSQEEGDTKVIKLRSLDPDVTYKIEFHDRPEQNTTATGAKLMNEGLSVTMEGEYGSEWIWIME